MASVFLSYDHDDAAKAQAVARALEKAGHSVWWDLHLRGGTEYSKVIEQSLKAADVVVVLWSRNAVESAWVRDEAADGRDTGRLVPVTLDGTEPPLGFRQFQTIDFGGWKGRRAPPALKTLLADVATMARSSSDVGHQAPVPPSTTKIATSGFSPIWLLLAGLVVAVMAASAYWLLAPDRTGVTKVVVAAADPPGKALAENLLMNLSNMRSVQEGSVQLLGADEQGRPDLRFQTEATNQFNEAGLVLTNGKDGTIFWSKQFERGAGTLADLQQRIAYTAGRVLGCAMEGLQPDGKPLRAQTLRLYLTACSQYAEASDETRLSVVPVLEQVVRDAPSFAAAWAKLLLAESDAVAEDNTRDRTNLRRYVARARELDPEMAEATLAEVTLLPNKAFGEALRLLDKAKESDPKNPAVLGYRSLVLATVGRMTEAIADAKEAARLDPTSPDALNNYVLVLAYSARIEAARAELQRAERLWPGTGRLKELQYAFNLRFGDAKEMVKSEKFKESNPRMQMYYRTRADPTEANIDRLMTFLQELYRRRGLTATDVVGHSQAYGELGREDDLYNLIFRLPASADLSQLAGTVFRPSLRKFRHDPRFMIVANRIGLVDYWTKSDKWPDFCFDPDQPYDCKVEAAKLGAQKKGGA